MLASSVRLLMIQFPLPPHTHFKRQLDAAFRSKNASGWSLHIPSEVRSHFYKTISNLKAYYAHANEELYRLMGELGPGVALGWEGPRWD